MARQGTSVTKVLSFTNSVKTDFKATLNVQCDYQGYVPPAFATALANVTLISELNSAWKLPSVVEGSFAPTTVTFTAASPLNGFLTFDAATKIVSYDGTKYGTSLTTSTVTLILTDAEGNARPP